MRKKMMMIAVATLALVSGPMAHAKKDGGPMSSQHMSQQGRENANSPMMGQEKGQERSMDRMNDSGMDHRKSGSQDGQGKAKGHDKDPGHGKGRGNAKGHDK